MALLQNCSNQSKLLRISHVPVPKVFSLSDHCIFQLPFVPHPCKFFCNLGFTSQCLDCSGRNTSQAFDLKKRGTELLSSGKAINFREIKTTSRAPFSSPVCKTGCHINSKGLGKDLRANKVAVLWELSVTSVFFQWSVEAFKRFREEPRAPIEPRRNLCIYVPTREKAHLSQPSVYLHLQLKNSYS